MTNPADPRVYDPGQDRFIDELYVWICVDNRTSLEGICAIRLPDGRSMQAVTSNHQLAMKLGDGMKGLPKESYQTYKLVRFKKCEEMSIEP